MKRKPELDTLRGLAILLMVADHLFLFADAPALWRAVTRPAFPLFFLVSGLLFRERGRGPSRLRLVQIGLAGVLTSMLLANHGAARFGFPDICVIWLMAYGIWWSVGRRAPLATLVLVPVLWFVEPWLFGPVWTNHPLASGVLWMTVGGFVHVPNRCRVRVLAWVGRYPLAWYLTHLWLLVGLDRFRVPVRWLPL